MIDKKVLAAALFAPLLFAGAASAYTQLYRFQYCSSIPDKAERLACYDNYARELGLSPAEPTGGISASQKVQGRWTVRAETTRKTNSVFVFTEGRLAKLPTKATIIPTLVARCENRTTELFIGYGNFFPVEIGPEEKSILYTKPEKSTSLEKSKKLLASVRFDGGTPISVMMRPSQDGRGYFFSNPVSYIRQLRSHKLLEFHYEASEHPPLDTLFSLEGFEEALEPLRKQCEW